MEEKEIDMLWKALELYEKSVELEYGHNSGQMYEFYTLRKKLSALLSCDLY